MFKKMDLNLRKRRWLELLKDFGKANVVVYVVIRLSMGSEAHIDDGKKELVRDVHRLAQLGVQLLDSIKGGVMVHNGFESSFVADESQARS